MNNMNENNYNNYYSYGRNANNFVDTNGSQMRQRMPSQETMNYMNTNQPMSCRPVNAINGNTHYRRPHPYYGQKGCQYRAQVIDYSNGSQRPPMVGMSSSHPQILANNSHSPQVRPRPQTGLLPTPQTDAYQSGSYYGRPSLPPTLSPSLPPPQSSPLFPISNQLNHQSYGSLPQQIPYPNYNQPNPPPLPPQPVPPPLPPLPPPVSNPIPNQSIVKIEVDIESQRRHEESRDRKLFSEGMETRFQNDLKRFYCLFCEVFCTTFNSAERHVESPKHQRTKIGENFKGIDAKFTIKSERITEMAVALARKEELNKISNVIKNDYFNEGIRLKDGIGSEAYICENCGVFADSLTGVNKHLELHKQFAEQLKICSKPVIGLDFITEYIDPDPSKQRVYECVMCLTFSSSKEIITHVCSYSHRTNFIKRIHPSEGLKYTSETPQLSLEAGKRALELETLIGRGDFKVKNQSAPKNCFIKAIAENYVCLSPNMSVPKRTPMENMEAFIQESKPKAMTELEEVLSVRLNTESDANEVIKVITNLTNSVMEYHIKGMAPEVRQQFIEHLKDQTGDKTWAINLGKKYL